MTVTTVSKNEVKAHVYKAEEVPLDFHEIGILGSYRHPASSPLDCLKSIFSLHNETFNIWTHIISTGVYVWFTVETAFSVNLWTAKTLPLLGLLITSCLFPLGSAFAHMFSCMSTSARHVCFMIDYFTISLYAYGACIANKAYAFPTSWQGNMFDDYFLLGNLVNCIGTVALSCQTRFMASGKRMKMLRLSAFVLPYVFGMWPCFQRTLSHESADSMLASQTYYSHFIMMGITVLFYGSHCPERIFPGMFDIIGHSHQIFHVLVVWATYLHSCGIIHDLKHRMDLPARLTVTQSMGSLLLLTVINAFTLAHFSYRIYHLKRSQSTNELNKKIS